jgi:hypothetical protein
VEISVGNELIRSHAVRHAAPESTVPWLTPGGGRIGSTPRDGFDRSGAYRVEMSGAYRVLTREGLRRRAAPVEDLGGSFDQAPGQLDGRWSRSAVEDEDRLNDPDYRARCR